MKKIQLGNGAVIFLLFFGVAVLDALKSRNWLQCIFWIAIGALFIVADNTGKPDVN